MSRGPGTKNGAEGAILGAARSGLRGSKGWRLEGSRS